MTTDIGGLGAGLGELTIQKAVDRDVRMRFSGEGRPNPIGVPAFKFKSGQLGHKIQFRRPNVAVRRMPDPNLPALPKSEMVRHDPLIQHIIDVEADIVGF